MPPVSRAFALLSFIFLGRAAIAAAPNSLPERITPVPSDQPVPVVDFVRPPLFEQAVLNPAGTYIAAFSKGSNLRDTVVFFEAGGGKCIPSGVESSGFDWVDNSHLILDNTEDAVVDIKGPGRLDRLSRVLTDGRYGLNAETGFLRTREARDLGGSDELMYLWNQPSDGEAAFYQNRDGRGRSTLYRRVKGRWEKCPVDLDVVTPLACGEKSDELIVIGPAAPGQPRAIQRLDASTGQLGEIIYRDAKYDVHRVIFRRGTRDIAGVVVLGVTPRVVWLDERIKAAQQLLNQQFAGSLVRILSMNVALSRFTVQVESDRQPPTYYLLDTEKSSLGLIKNASPWIDPQRMGTIKVVGFNTRDHVALEAYLTLPPGTTKERPVPLLVSVHGGPWAQRANWGWSPANQCMAAAGYAVLEVNYRGSVGYDSRVSERDRFDFDKMSADVLDGVRAAIRTGVVDPKRMAIEGYGFGGYLAMRSVLEEPTLFRCAMVYGGVYDWKRAFADKNASNRNELLWLKGRLDEFGIAPVSILERSSEIKIPLFFVRNVRLRDVAIESQIEKLHSAVRGRVPCVNFGDLNIYTYDEAYGEMVDRYVRMREFLAQHLMLHPATTAAH